MIKATKITGLSSIILLLILLNTRPEELPTVALVVPFLLLFIIIASIAGYLLSLFGVPKGSRLRIAFIGGAVPVLLLVMQSLGQLSIRDALAIVILFGVIHFYVARLNTGAASHS